jgi:hypothetical protein
MTNIKTEIDERSNDLKARFVLGELGDNNLVVVGVNPSVATIKKLDPTAKRIKKYSEIHEYTGWIIINLYPQIDPNVDELNKEKNDELIKLNLENIETILKRDDITLVAAWGEAIKWRKYLKDCFRDIDALAKKYNHEWHCIELTKYGHPCHPLMRKKDFSLYKSKVKSINIDFDKAKATLSE